MRKTGVVTIALILAIVGCHGKEQKQQDLAAETKAVNDQLLKDCPKFDPNDSTGVQAALGQKPSTEQQAAAQQRRVQIQATLDSPHCKELQSKLDGLYREAMTQQN